jgi:hypothetical protein
MSCGKKGGSFLVVKLGALATGGPSPRLSLVAGVTAPAGISTAPAFSICLVTDPISSSQLFAKDAIPRSSNVAATSKGFVALDRFPPFVSDPVEDAQCLQNMVNCNDGATIELAQCGCICCGAGVRGPRGKDLTPFEGSEPRIGLHLARMRKYQRRRLVTVTAPGTCKPIVRACVGVGSLAHPRFPPMGLPAEGREAEAAVDRDQAALVCWFCCRETSSGRLA